MYTDPGTKDVRVSTVDFASRLRACDHSVCGGEPKAPFKGAKECSRSADDEIL